MDRELLWGDSEAIKLFSMRENPQILYFCLIYVIDYSCLFYFTAYVKMSMAWGQYAWVETKFFAHQRLNKEYLNYKNKNNENKEWFEQWLVGMTDGDGTFYISFQNNSWNLVYKIALSRYNLRALYYIKKQLDCGSVIKDNTKGQFCIKDRKQIEKTILPLFDKYPLLTSKYFDYSRFKQALYILNNSSLSKQEKDEKIFLLKNYKLPSNYVSPVWKAVDLSVINSIKEIVTKPWLVGFIEAEGSFYFTTKDSNRIVHGFGLTQKLDNIVLESIKFILHIPTKVRYKSKHNYYILDTTNSRAIENIIIYFKNTMKGMKSVEYRIWVRSYNKYKGNYEKLLKIRDIIRKMKKNY